MPLKEKILIFKVMSEVTDENKGNGVLERTHRQPLSL